MLDDLNRLPPVRRADDLHFVVFQNGCQRKDVARVVVHHEGLATAERLVGIVQAREHILLRFRQVRHHAVEEERGFIEEPVR